MDVPDDPTSPREPYPGDARSTRAPDDDSNGNGDSSSSDGGILSDVGQLWDSTGEMVQAMLQRIAAEACAWSVRLSMAMIALAAAAAMAVMAVIFTCMGIADGLTVALGGRVWAADLLTAALAAIMLYVTARFAAEKIRSALFRCTQEPYERPEHSVAGHAVPCASAPEPREPAGRSPQS
jgi:hypothetical protein